MSAPAKGAPRKHPREQRCFQRYDEKHERAGRGSRTDFKAKAGEFAGASADRLKDQASNFADTAKDVADQAGDKLKEAVTERKTAGADYVGNLAEAMRRAGREFDNELPIAGKYIRKAASQVETVADSIRTGDFNDLVRNARSFARRQPTAFLGIAALAGIRSRPLPQEFVFGDRPIVIRLRSGRSRVPR